MDALHCFLSSQSGSHSYYHGSFFRDQISGSMAVRIDHHLGPDFTGLPDDMSIGHAM